MAGELHWFKPYTKVLEWNEPFAKWFVGGQTNASYNCLDAHLSTGTRTRRRSSGKASRATRRTLTYQQLHREVCKFANVLKTLGIEHGRRRLDLHADGARAGDRHAGLRRIGAVHSVIFGGFSSEAIADRNNDAKAKLHDHGRLRLAARPAVAAQAERRRGAGQIAHASKSASCCAAPAARST